MLYFCIKILDFYEKISYDSIKKEDKFFKLLTVKNEKELREITKDIKELDSYVDKLKDLSNNKDYRGALMNERIVSNILKQDAYYTAYHAGIDQGIEENKREMVISLNNQGVSLDIISEASKLTIPEIEKIINEIKEK